MELTLIDHPRSINSARESRPMAKHTIREELVGVLTFVGIIWFVFAIGHILPIQFESFGVTPRTHRGLVGIPAAPLLHSNMGPLIINTITLTVLLVLLAGSKAQSWSVVAWIVLLSGALLWVLGRPATHIGASSLIYGLIAYLIVSGIREQRIVPMIISLAVGCLYGGTLVSGVMPRLNSQISWEGHLFGAIAGGIVAYFMTRDRGGVEETVVNG
jgi:membrane associated rhomboid family serine protease